jgi:EAL and modified HD-GYP domain-containing signal transduction protein
MYERFIARQPILTHKLTLLGYELLFRTDSKNNATADPNATSHVISSSTMLFGWERLVGPWLGFINFGAAELLNGAALLLPHAQTVVELPASLATTKEVVAACAGLHEAKYRIALDNFRDEPERHELLAYTDFLKVDFQETSEAEQRRLSEKYAESSTALIAVKVETWEEYKRAQALRFRHFQGFFFLEPRTLERKDLRGSRVGAMRLLQACRPPRSA